MDLVLGDGGIDQRRATRKHIAFVLGNGGVVHGDQRGAVHQNGRADFTIRNRGVAVGGAAAHFRTVRWEETGVLARFHARVAN